VKVAALATLAAAAALAVGAAPALGATPFLVKTSLSTDHVYLGDTVTARVTVLADGREVDPRSINLTAGLGDWDQVAPTKTTSTTAGPFTRRTWSFVIACLQPACLAHGKPLTVHLPAVSVSATRPDGSTVRFQQSWPAIAITPRFGPAPRGATPDFDVDQTLPAATFRVGPTWLALGLDVAAVLLALLAAWIVVREVLRHRPKRVQETPPLTRALAFVRQSKARPSDDRRRAVGLLARTLASDDDDSLSAAASSVAWSAGEPDPDGLEELARRVETAHEEKATT
jgi:hypothetical protein